MELNIGSNIIRNTSGVLNVQGKEQIGLEIGKIDKQLLLTMEIYDSNGQLIGKLVRNAWVHNDNDRFIVTTHPTSLKLIDKQTGGIIVEAKVTDKGNIEIPQGIFYTHRGHMLEITPQYWRIMGITMSGNIFDSCGGAVEIG